MVSKLHQRFGTAGLIVAIVALVAALAGTAFAAQQALNSKQKKEVKAIAKKYAGKKGKDGAPGPQGPKGDTGAAGPAGTNGTNGTNGADGAKGATGATGPTGTNGTNGTNGATGATGPTGQTGFTATLPSGSTETGSWAALTSTTGKAVVPLSFPIPLPAPITEFTKTIFNPIPGCSKTGTGNLTEASKVVEGATTGFCVGSFIAGTKIPAGTYIARKISGTKFELSEPVEAGGTGVGVALTGTPRTPNASCENAGHAGAAGPENPEAQSGFLCVYAARDGLAGAAGRATVSGFFFRAGGIESANSGASVSGGSLFLTDFNGAEAGSEVEVAGTFAVMP